MDAPLCVWHAPRMDAQPNPQSTARERFMAAMRKILTVPKEEILRREEEYRKARGKQKPR